MKNKATKAYEMAYQNEKKDGGCAQATIKALMELYDMEDSRVYQGMTGFSGGGGCLTDGSCGAYLAGTYFISTFCGRAPEDIGIDPDDLSGIKKSQENFALVTKLHNKFIEEFGVLICNQLHRKLYGRPFFLGDFDEKVKFNEAGAHDWGCTSVCGNAAKWTVEILEEYLEEQKLA